ncbi:MAG TPA: hypothetical protein VNO34_08830 [Actinomycetota bacterium]|nr:hypothetical protein [Actinomycetota bacterium]
MAASTVPRVRFLRRPRRERLGPPDPLPLDPRDPDVVRTKEAERARALRKA